MVLLREGARLSHNRTPRAARISDENATSSSEGFENGVATLLPREIHVYHSEQPQATNLGGGSSCLFCPRMIQR